MDYRTSLAMVWVGCLLSSGCPGPDKADTEGSTDPMTATTTPATSATETTGGASTTGAPTTGAGMSTSTGGAAVTACEQYQAADLHELEVYCPCAVEAGSYPDVETCITGNQSEGHDEVDCLCEIAAMDPMHGAYVACLAEASENYANCISPLSCKDITGLGPAEQECFGASLAANHVCYKLSKEALLAEEACLDLGPPFMCDSGEAVPYVYLCDGEDDCMDMSDETDNLCQP